MTASARRSARQARRTPERCPYASADPCRNKLLRTASGLTLRLILTLLLLVSLRALLPTARVRRNAPPVRAGTFRRHRRRLQGSHGRGPARPGHRAPPTRRAGRCPSQRRARAGRGHRLGPGRACRPSSRHPGRARLGPGQPGSRHGSSPTRAPRRIPSRHNGFGPQPRRCTRRWACHRTNGYRRSARTEAPG